MGLGIESSKRSKHFCYNTWNSNAYGNFLSICIPVVQNAFAFELHLDVPLKKWIMFGVEIYFCVNAWNSVCYNAFKGAADQWQVLRLEQFLSRNQSLILAMTCNDLEQQNHNFCMAKPFCALFCPISPEGKFASFYTM